MPWRTAGVPAVFLLGSPTDVIEFAFPSHIAASLPENPRVDRILPGNNYLMQCVQEHVAKYPICGIFRLQIGEFLCTL
jgi:hypothetical protein